MEDEGSAAPGIARDRPGARAERGPLQDRSFGPAEAVPFPNEGHCHETRQYDILLKSYHCIQCGKKLGSRKECNPWRKIGRIPLRTNFAMRF